MIFIAGISIALFIAALLLVKKDKATSDKFLFLWMILNAIHLTFSYLVFSEEIYNYPYLLGWKFPLPLLHGVLLYYYVSSVTDQFPKNKWIALSHLIPALITVVYLIPFLLLPAEQKIEIFEQEGKGYETFLQVLLIGVFISGVAYVIWSSLLLRIHRKRIRDEFSNIEELSLSWLQFITYGLGVVWAIVIFTQNETSIFMVVSIFVILIGFFGVQQKNDQELSSKKKYITSGLSEEKAIKCYEQLGEIMVHEKIYTQSELSLNDLASKLEIHPNYLSQIINIHENKTFYDYINEYRVEEFKRLISIPENRQFTLMSLAYESGFNSKSTFNRYFKKTTNQTPSEYVNFLKG